MGPNRTGWDGELDNILPIPVGKSMFPEPDILLILSILSPYPTGDSVPCLWKPGLAPGPALYLLVGVPDIAMEILDKEDVNDDDNYSFPSPLPKSLTRVCLFDNSILSGL